MHGYPLLPRLRRVSFRVGRIRRPPVRASMRGKFGKGMASRNSPRSQRQAGRQAAAKADTTLPFLLTTSPLGAHLSL